MIRDEINLCIRIFKTSWRIETVFGIAITDKPLETIKSADVKHFEQNNRFFVVRADDLFTKLQWTMDGFQISESAIPVKDQKEDDEYATLSKIVVDTKNETIDVYNPTILGRSIYYHNNGRNFYCSTHISFLRDVDVPIEENTAVLPEFFVYRYVMPPNTLYKGIKKTIFGEELRFAFANGKVALIKSSRFIPTISKTTESSVQDYSRKVEKLLTNSIKSLKPAKSNVTSLLSGGLDSSILFKLSKNILGINGSFSTGYPFIDSRGDVEKKYALSAAEALGAEHNHIEFTVDDYLKGFIEAIDAAEEPVHHLQSVMFYLLFKKGLPSNIHTIISGAGADTLFGMDTHNIIFTYQNSIFLRLLVREPFGKILGKLMTKITKRNYSGAVELMNGLKINNTEDPQHALWKVCAYGSKQWAINHLNTTNNNIIKGRFGIIKNYREFSIYDSTSILDLAGEIATDASLWGKIAEKNKKMLFCPFCDKKLIEYSFLIPWDIKLQKPKNILRYVARLNQISEFIIKRRKSGFGVGAEAWAVKGGIFDPLIPLCDKIFKRDEIINMQSADHEKSMIFWNMLNYAIWKRLFIYQEPVSNLLDELGLGGDL